MLPIACAFVFQLAGQTADATIPVRHRRASLVVQGLEGFSATLPGVLVLADDVHEVIHVSGPAEDVKEIQSMVNFADVPMRQLGIEMVIDSPADHVHKTLQTEIGESTNWSFEDSELQIKMKLRVRINDDGTITEHVTSAYCGTERTMVMRLHQSETAYYRPGYFASQISWVDPDKLAALDAKGVPTLLLKAKWLDGK